MLVAAPILETFECVMLRKHLRYGQDLVYAREPHAKELFPECVAKGSRLTLGGLGVEPCS